MPVIKVGDIVTNGRLTGIVVMRQDDGKVRSAEPWYPEPKMAPRPEADGGDEDPASAWRADLLAPFRNWKFTRV